MKLIEEALFRHPWNLRYIMDIANMGVGIIDAGDRIVFVNTKLADMLGCTRAEMIGKSGFGYDGDLVSSLRPSQWEKTENAGFSRIIRYRRKDGGLVWSHVSVSPIFDCSNVYLGFFSLHVDLTEQKLAEEQLRARQAKLESIFRAAPVGIGISVNRVMKEANIWLCEMLGYAKDEFIDRDARLFYPRDVEYRQVGKAISSVRENDNISTIETRWQRKDGGIIDVLLCFTLIEQGDPQAGVTFTAVDITGRKQAEQVLRRANRALKALTKCGESLVHSTDENALLQDICQIIVEVGGYRLAWIGYAEMDPAKTIRPMAFSGYENGYVGSINALWSDADRGRGPTGIAIRTGRHHIVRYIRNDSKFTPWREEALKRGYASVIGLPLHSNDTTFGALTIYSETPDAFDTEEVELLSELADNLAFGIMALRDRIQRNVAEKAHEDARDQAELYLDLMGHDINNLNQVGIGFLEIALDTLDLDDYGRDLLSHPLTALEGSSLLISNVKKLQKVRSGEIRHKKMDVGDVLERVREHYSNLHGENIVINCPYTTGYTVIANELLYDVFSNLVGNAIKHSNGRPAIDISVERVRENDVECCRITVEDNGPGIPDDLKVRIFNRHLRGNTKAKGSGIGLYLVKTLADDFGGRVHVEDRVPGDRSKGSKFIVVLPMVKNNISSTYFV
ncbi:MAG: PAS domain S-box protein [Methanocella sp.]